MRKTGICPKCEHRHLLQILEVADSSDSGYSPLRVALRFEGDGWLGEKRSAVGVITAFMCRSCGFTELYVAKPELVVPDGKYIVEHSAPGETSPYR